MKTLSILLGIFAENAIVNVLVSILVVIFIGWLAFFGIGRIKEPFPFRNIVYVVVTVLLIALFLYLIGIFPR